MDDALQARVDHLHVSVQDIGNLIADLREDGVATSMVVHFNEGSESIVLHNLSGELDLRMCKQTELRPQGTKKPD